MLILVKFFRTKTYFSIRMENRMKSYFLAAKHFIAENSVEFNAIKENVFGSVAFDWCHKIKSLIIYKFDDFKCRGFFFSNIFFHFSFVSNILQTFSWCLPQRLYFKRSTPAHAAAGVSAKINFWIPFELTTHRLFPFCSTALAWTTLVGSLLWWINLVPDTRPFASPIIKGKVSHYTRVSITWHNGFLNHKTSSSK